MRIPLPFALALTAAVAAVAPGLARAKPTNCGTRSVGPGSLVRGTDKGATCLLGAYQAHCRTAVYDLSSFGVDTIDENEFRVVAKSGACLVTVTIFFRVVPQPSRLTGQATCRLLGRKGKDVVASRCSGATGFPASISLTTGR